jgi:hypothetical protein
MKDPGIGLNRGGIFRLLSEGRTNPTARCLIVKRGEPPAIRKAAGSAADAG